MSDKVAGPDGGSLRRRRARAGDVVAGDLRRRADGPEPGPSSPPPPGSRRAARLAAAGSGSGSAGGEATNARSGAFSVPPPGSPPDVSGPTPAPGEPPTSAIVLWPPRPGGTPTGALRTEALTVGPVTGRPRRRTISLPESLDEIPGVAAMPVRTAHPPAAPRPLAGRPHPADLSIDTGRPGPLPRVMPSAPSGPSVAPAIPFGSPEPTSASMAAGLSVRGRRTRRGAGDAAPRSSEAPDPAAGPVGTASAAVYPASGGRSGTDAFPSDSAGRGSSDGGAGRSETAASRADRHHGDPGRSRAGRNLPMAILVGVTLGGLVLASLLIRKEAFVGVVGAAAVLSVWELARAFAVKGITVPVMPLAVGSVGMLVSAFVAREDGLLVSFGLTVFGALLWRLIDGFQDCVRDVTASVFTTAYVPFLAGFAVLMLVAPDGDHRVITFVLVTVASDIGGYAAGVLFGRHPMAPRVSPKKSWEGFAGSVTGCVTAGILGVVFLLDGPWWAGAAVGAAAVVTATVGDLCESLIKRDLGIKDMGHLLPGHGGMLDRIDSLLLTAPVVYVLLSLLV